MRAPLHRALRGLAVSSTLCLCVGLTGCGGGSGEGSTTTGGSTAGASVEPTTPPTEADHEAAHERVVALREAYVAAEEAGGAYQRAVTEVLEKDPSAAPDDPSLADRRTELETAQRERDAALEAIGEERALAEPDVRAAYDALVEAHGGYRDFTDAFYLDFPLMRKSFSACTDAFELEEDPDTSSIRAVAQAWLRQHTAAVTDCRPVLAQLRESDNDWFSRYAAGLADVLERRERAMTRARDAEISPDAAVRALEAANADFKVLGSTNTDYSGEMGRRGASEEYDALHAALDEQLGGHGTAEE